MVRCLMDGYSGSALGIQILPQSQVLNRPCFEIRSAGAVKIFPSVSATVLASFFRTDRPNPGHGCNRVMQSSETTSSYVRTRLVNTSTNNNAKMMPLMTAPIESRNRYLDSVGDGHRTLNSICKTANSPVANRTLTTVRLRSKPANSGVTR